MAPVALFKAIYRNNINLVKRRIECGDDVNYRKVSTGKHTPLHEAILHDHVEIAELLLKSGAHPDGAARFRVTDAPLHLAILNRNLEATSLLIDFGADINFPGEGRYTPLHLAIGSEWNPKRNDSDESNYVLPFVTYLIEKGAELDPINRQGYTPIATAAKNKLWKVFWLLYDAGARIAMPHSHNIMSAVIQSAENQNTMIKLLKKLLKKGAEPNSGLQGYTPIATAAKRRLWKVFWYLHDVGATIAPARSRNVMEDIIESGEDHRTILKLIKKLLRRGEAVSQFAPHLATKYKQHDLVDLLIEHGADLDVRDHSGSKPFHYALRNDDKVLMRKFLDAGFDPTGIRVPADL